MSSPFDAAFTVDLEPDCPPFLAGYRGVEQGLPRLLTLLAGEKIRATFFTTGDVANKYPRSVEAVIEQGHELGCHGLTHTSFTEMSRDSARREIAESAAVLRRFADVTSFRAPYLRFPDEFLGLLHDANFSLDSSQARYKWPYSTPGGGRDGSELTRIPASLTSSVLRTPKPIRETYLRALRAPVVLFVHPWEFVDLRRERIRYDCRFRTGDIALECVGDVLRSMVSRGARFKTMREMGREWRGLFGCSAGP